MAPRSTTTTTPFRRPALRLLCAGLVLTLGVACTSDDGAEETDRPQPPTAQPFSPPPAIEKRFGESYAYADGVTLDVGEPRPYQPTKDAAVDPAPAYVVFEVRLRNGGADLFDPSLVAASLESGGKPGVELLDVDGDVQGVPAAALSAGEAVTFRVGFGVQDAADLRLKLTRDFERAPLVFTR